MFNLRWRDIGAEALHLPDDRTARVRSALAAAPSRTTFSPHRQHLRAAPLCCRLPLKGRVMDGQPQACAP